MAGLLGRDLQDIGRANPVGMYQEYQKNKEAINLQRQQQELGTQQQQINTQLLQQNEMKLKEAQRNEAIDNTYIPINAFTEDVPHAKGPNGVPLPNLSPSQKPIMMKLLEGIKDQNGNTVIQNIGGQVSAPWWAAKKINQYIQEDAKSNGEVTKALAEARMNDSALKSSQANEEVIKIIQKNPQASPNETIKDQYGQDMSNPNYDPKLKEAIMLRDREWMIAQDIRQRMGVEWKPTSMEEKIIVEQAGKSSLRKTELEMWMEEHPESTVDDYWNAKNTSTNKTNYQFAGLDTQNPDIAVVFDPNKGEFSRVPVGSIGAKQLTSLGAEKTQEIGVSNAVIQGIERIQKAIQEDPTLMEKVGAIEGRWMKAKRLFMEDPKAEGLNREVESLIRIAYGWSGKQISIQEIDRLQKAILPSLSNPDANFMVSLDHAKRIMETDRNAKLQAYKDARINIGDLDKYINGNQGGTIRVKLIESGQTGTIPENEYDPNIYERL